MRKQLLGLLLFGLSGSALAASTATDALLPTNNIGNCSALIQQGAVASPVPSNDLSAVETCMKSCNDLYKTLRDNNRLVDMLNGTTYCRKSLNNLYFASVAQTIDEQLNEQTRYQTAAQQNALQAQLRALAASRSNNQTQQTPPVTEEATDGSSYTPAANPSPIVGPSNDINW